MMNKQTPSSLHLPRAGNRPGSPRLAVRRWGYAAAVLLMSGPPLASLFAGTDVASVPAGKNVTLQKADDNPLSFDDGMLTVDVQERLRVEVRNNTYDFNSAVDAITDDSFLLERFRLGLLVKPTSWLDIYGQTQDSREIGSKRPNIPGLNGAEGTDAFDVRQAYLKIGDLRAFPLTLTAGRQILSYGDERLVGSFDWNNIGRTFDAVKLSYDSAPVKIDGFVSSVVVPDRGSYDQSDLFNGTEKSHGIGFSGTSSPVTGVDIVQDQVFSGIYASSNYLSFQTTEAYVFYLHENNRLTVGKVTTQPDTDFATLGTRVKSNANGLPPQLKNFDYDLETAFQVGEVRDLDLLSYAFHGGVGYTFADILFKPRIYAEYNYASGDSNPNDGKIGTFQNLFPTNHKFYGYLDAFSWQNLHNPAVSLRFTPIEKKLFLEADYLAFLLADTNDRAYRANGVTAIRPLTPGARSADNYVGSEVDLKATYTPLRFLSFELGYSHFFAGSYLEQAPIAAVANSRPASSDADFFYAMTTISF
jgi:hypothetical protein